MSTDTENKLPTLEEATKRLEDLKKEIDSSNPAKHGIPENIQRLRPSQNQKKIKYFGQSSAYGARISNKIKDKFREYQETGELKLGRAGRRPESDSGTEGGKFWHDAITEYIKNPSQNKDGAGEAVIKALKSNGSIVKDIEFLQAEFPLYGFMKMNLDDNFWNGKADAIGWFEDKYVIVDWKAVDLLELWEKKPLPYGDYLHQCLVYARLLQLHLGLKKLPYILIVPISRITGDDIHPALFRDFPKECKEKIGHYDWSKELKVLETDVAKTLPKTLLEESFTVPNDGIVPGEARVRDVLKGDVTVSQLLETLGLNLLKLKVA